MSATPGRNDPRPCGSGKKYKKCCGRDAALLDGLLLPDDQRTGTPLDDYLELFPLLAIHAQGFIQFDAGVRDLKRARDDYEKRFRPGEEGGLMDSHYMSWLHFDLRFGKSRKTIVERVLDDPLTAKLAEPGPTYLHHMAESYATFYEVIDEGPEVVLLDELGTGRRWSIYYYRELFETPPHKGTIWYTRLLGPPDRVMSYTTPYVYEQETRAQFKRAVDGLVERFLKNPLSIGVPADRLFIESQKESVLLWTEYIYFSNNVPAEMLSSVPGQWPQGRLPDHVVNTDKQELVFTEMHFKVKDEPALRKRLARMKTFAYDEQDDSWNWFKAPSRKFPDEPRTLRGHFRFKDGYLVAETNSRERAAWLEYKLLGHFRGMLKLEKTLYRDLEDIPPLPPEEREKRDREAEEFNARPEVREALRQQLEHHYFDKWPHMKVPLLGNIPPLQASKTEAGREKLSDLLDYLDRRQDADDGGQPTIDFGKLRRILGLPAKSH